MTVVQPEYDFKTAETDGKLVFEMKTHIGGGGMIAGTIIGSLALIVLMFTLIGGAYFFAVVAAIFAFVGFKFALSKKTSKVVFGEKSILVDGNIYLTEHIESIGYDSAGPDGPVVLNQATIAFTRLRHATGHFIYIVYGSKRIPIITGLTPDNVEPTYRRIRSFFQKYGRTFGG